MTYQYTIKNYPTLMYEVEQSMHDEPFTHVKVEGGKFLFLRVVDGVTADSKVVDSDYPKVEGQYSEVERVISGGMGFVLNGLGWAKDNYVKTK